MKQRERLDLPEDTPGLCILDVFAAHRCAEFLQKFDAYNLKCVFVPAGCTGMLQPLDVSINDLFKKHLKHLFNLWYSHKVKEDLDKRLPIENVKVDLRTSTIKPIQFKCLIENHTWLAEQDKALLRGWKESGILDVLVKE